MAGYITRGTTVRATIKHKKLAKPLVKSFSKHDTEQENRKEAVSWAKEQEAKLTLNQLIDMSESKKVPFDCILVRYRDSITEHKAKTTKNRELSKIRVIRSQVTGYSTELLNSTHSDAQLEGYSLADINDIFICNYILKRMNIDKVAWETVDKELQVISSAIDTSVLAWGYKAHQGAKRDGIKLFDMQYKNLEREAVHRDRRVTQSEYKALCRIETKHSLVAQLAIETAMRRGEICNAVVADFNRANSTLRIPISKTDKKQRTKGRIIPLSKRAIELVAGFSQGKKNSASLVGCSDPKSLSQGWDRLAVKLNIDDLRFHDFRHEGTSRFFEKGLSIEQVALITGHSSWKSLQRYTQLKPENLVGLLG
jgi:integrase